MALKKRIGILLCCAALLFSCAGCQARQTSVEYLIGVSLANLSEQWRLVLKNELEAEVTRYDNVRLVFSDAAGSGEKQVEDIQKLMKYGIDLLIISPTDVDQLLSTISDVYAQLPVIVLDRAVEGYDYSLFIGPDNQIIGEQAGQIVLELLEKRNDNSAVLELMARGYANQERSETFLQTMKDAAVPTYQALLDSATRDCAEDALLKNPEILNGVGVIFAHNDYMAYGASLALEALGRTDINVVGLDGFEGEGGGLELVRQGRIDATVTCPTGGKTAIQSALEILTHTSGVPKKIILRSQTIHAGNVEQVLQERSQPAPEAPKRIRVGHVQIGDEGGWRKANYQSIVDAAREFGVDLTMVEGEQSLEKQIDLVRQFIAEKMDVIVLSPVVETGWEEVLQEAKDAGIPVMLSDRKANVSEDLYTTFIGADFMEQGKRCAGWMLDNVSNQACVNILEIQGAQDATPTKERKLGFEMAIGEYPGCQIVYSDYGDYNREGGKRVIRDYLEQNQWDIDVIFCHNDDMALGAIEVLEQNGIRPGQDVKIISIDGTSDALDALRKGKINCVVECNPLLGPQLLKAITDLMNGKEPALRIITDEIVFTAQTPSESFRNRQY